MIFVAYELNLPLNMEKPHYRSQRANGAWFGLMTVARYIALSLISRYHCLDPTNRDISGLHCIGSGNDLDSLGAIKQKAITRSNDDSDEQCHDGIYGKNL